MTVRWTLLIYRVPPQPTRIRLSIWRKLQALGAVYLQDGVAALPTREDLDENMRVVAADVEEYGGSAMVFASEVSGPEGLEIQEMFRALADKRYGEIVSSLDDALGLLKPNMSLLELEEAEQAATRERIAYLRSKRIAYFGGTLEQVIEDKLALLRNRLDELSQQKLKV